MTNGACLSFNIHCGQLSLGNASHIRIEPIFVIFGAGDLFLVSHAALYLQLLCEEDTQNMLGSEQWEVLPRSSDKEK